MYAELYTLGGITEFLNIKQIATYVYLPLHSKMLTYKPLSSAHRVQFVLYNSHDRK